MSKPRLGFWQIWNMSFGFLGIQFGWGLQMANMSAIYEYLGANADQIPLLWLAAPLTGLLVQPIIGSLSDRTWGPLGRRRPYFLVGALLSSLALILMPQAGSLWMAAGLLWILDVSINVSMEPFRAFVADLLPAEQRTRGFAMQSLFIGLGAIVASALPWLLTSVLHVADSRGAHGIPHSVALAFYLGAAVFLGAVLWTVVRTREYPPEDLDAFRAAQKRHQGFGATLTEIRQALSAMPTTMRQLAAVQIFTWLGLFMMWLYFPVAVAHHVYGITDSQSPAYAGAVAWGGLCFSMYSAVCFAVSFVLPRLAAVLGQQRTHALCLSCGGAGLLSVAVIHTPNLLLLAMAGVGVAWASILSMPYAMLADSLPAEKTGLYMGIFNFFIVIPEILASLGFGWVMTHLLHGNRLAAVVIGGLSLLLAAGLALRVRTAVPA